jgi:hypothetical protein
MSAEARECKRRRAVDSELHQADMKARTCQECGMLLDDAAEFHPYVFCVLKKAGRDPWDDVRWVVRSLGLGHLPPKPPLIRDLPRRGD